MTLSPAAQTLLARETARQDQIELRRLELRAAARSAAAVLVREYGARRVWVFGSLLQQWFRLDSDLDLAAEGIGEALVGPATDRLVECLGCPVDLVRFEEAEPSLRRRIEQMGEEIS